MSAKRINADHFSVWRRTLSDGETAKRQAPGANKPLDDTPIHPLRLCDEIKNFMQRDAILVVDGQGILNFGRQSMPTFTPGHRLNSGPFGTMGVGLPFGIGAKIAKPDKQVIVVHGDGSFGLNALELDTAVRHNIAILVVVSLNGGWTADPQRNKPGRNLGYTRFDKMAETLGCYGEYVERPDEIRPALNRAQREVDRGSVALVNVKTDDRGHYGDFCPIRHLSIAGTTRGRRAAGVNRDASGGHDWRLGRACIVTVHRSAQIRSGPGASEGRPALRRGPKRFQKI